MAPDIAQEHETGDAEPYVVISTDTHASPSLEHQLRPYCPKRNLPAFDKFVSEYRAAQARQLQSEAGSSERSSASRSDSAAIRLSNANARALDEIGRRAKDDSLACGGLKDPYERLRDMDIDGVAADVIFSGAPNGEVLPFLALGFDQGPESVSVELRALGSRIWNEWLADFVSVAPERHVGVMQVAISDIPGAVKEIERGAASGLKAVNLPAPRHDYPPYTEPVYEPLWSACEDLSLPLLTHVGGGEFPLGTEGPMGIQMYLSETDWLARRGLWQMIFGGVFESHSTLKLVFTEQRVAWVPETLAMLDSIYFSDLFPEVRQSLSKLPSEFWRSNCFLAGSFLAPFEAKMLNEVGDTNLMWGSDYPHMEGTWPRTRKALRHTFSEIAIADTRKILGENALNVYGFDRDALRSVARRIGPTPSELMAPLRPDEYPALRGLAFRQRGSFS